MHTRILVLGIGDITKSEAGAGGLVVITSPSSLARAKWSQMPI